MYQQRCANESARHLVTPFPSPWLLSWCFDQFPQHESYFLFRSSCLALPQRFVRKLSRAYHAAAKQLLTTFRLPLSTSHYSSISHHFFMNFLTFRCRLNFKKRSRPLSKSNTIRRIVTRRWDFSNSFPGPFKFKRLAAKNSVFWGHGQLFEIPTKFQNFKNQSARCALLVEHADWSKKFRNVAFWNYSFWNVGVSAFQTAWTHFSVPFHAIIQILIGWNGVNLMDSKTRRAILAAKNNGTLDKWEVEHFVATGNDGKNAAPVFLPDQTQSTNLDSYFIDIKGERIRIGGESQWPPGALERFCRNLKWVF